MGAISKPWVTIADGAVDADSPIDQALMTGIRDDLVHLREWIGASFVGAAVQDHNHDGVNSAFIGVGPNLLRNGGFESNTFGGWESLPNTGGTIAITGSGQSEGNYCATITSTVLSNGGGTLRSTATPVDGRSPYRFAVTVRASVANISSSVTVSWLDGALTQIGVSTVYASANTTTVGGVFERTLMPPTSARFAQVLLNGGLAGVGSSVGTITFDNAFMGEGWDKYVAPGNIPLLTTAGPIDNGEATGAYSKYWEAICGSAGTIRVRFTVDNGEARIYINGVAVGTERSSPTPASFDEDITISSGDLLQIYTKRTGGTVTLSDVSLRSTLPVGFNQQVP